MSHNSAKILHYLQNKLVLGALLVGLAAVIALTVGGAKPQVDAAYLGCSASGYIFRDNGGHTDVQAIDMVTGEGSNQPQVPGSSLNAVGYNPVDNHFYAWDLLNGRLVQLNTNFVIVNTWTPGEIGYVGPTNDIFSGDVDEDGTYWFFRIVAGTTHWYSIDLTQPTFVTQTGTTANATGTGGTDWAFIPGTDNLYRAMDSGGSIIIVPFNRTSKSFLPSIGTVTGISTATDGDMGSVYADPNNNMYMSSHVSGKLFRVSLDGPTFPAVELQDVDPSSNDGARCALADVPVDFGDAPTPYATLIDDDGPRHSIINFNIANSTATLMLGRNIDIENDGVPNVNSRGDDTHHDGLSGGSFVDDERGVTHIIATPGNTDPITVKPFITNTSGQAATLAGWIDLDGDTVFETSERVTASIPSGFVGRHALTFPSPAVPYTTSMYSRFRIFPGTVADPQPTGAFAGGEVEDVLVQVGRYDVSKAADPGDGSAVSAGSTVTYALSIQNTGSTPLTDLKIDDDLTDVLDDATLEGTPTVSPGSAGSVAIIGNTLEFTGNVGVGETVTVTYSVKVKEAGSLGNAGLNNSILASHSESCEPTVASDGSATVVDPDCQTTHAVNGLASTGSRTWIIFVLSGALLTATGFVWWRTGQDKPRR